tara:strand:- start:508 stop:1182 length:675 start_codon:yes stop_codon:yes gene_type:complete
MSHLVETVNTNEPNITANISLNIDELDDVTLSTPSSGQGLKYDGSEWINDDVSGSYDLMSYSITNGTAHGNLAAGFYSSFLLSFETPFFLAIRYREVPILMSNFNTSNIIILQKVINTNAIYNVGFRISANKKVLLCVDLSHCDADVAGTFVDLQWQTSAGVKLGPVVRTITTGSYNRQTIYGFISTTVETDVGLMRINNSAAFGSNQSTTIRQNCVFASREVN